MILAESSGWWPNDTGRGQANGIDGQWTIPPHWKLRQVSTRWTVRRYQKEPATWWAQRDRQFHLVWTYTHININDILKMISKHILLQFRRTRGNRTVTLSMRASRQQGLSNLPTNINKVIDKKSKIKTYMSRDKVGDQVEEETRWCSSKNITCYMLQSPYHQSCVHHFGQILHQESDENECHTFCRISSAFNQPRSDHPQHYL